MLQELAHNGLFGHVSALILVLTMRRQSVDLLHDISEEMEDLQPPIAAKGE